MNIFSISFFSLSFLFVSSLFLSHSTIPFPLVLVNVVAIFDFSFLYVFFYQIFYVLFDLPLTFSFTYPSYYHYVIFSSSPFFILHFPSQPCYSHVVFLFLPFLSLFLNDSLSRSISLLTSWFSFGSSSFISTLISSSFSSIFSISLPAFFRWSCLSQIPPLPPLRVFLFCLSLFCSFLSFLPWFIWKLQFWQLQG
jgi:hypothetical protein